MRAILTFLGTIVILTAFGELRPGRVAQLLAGCSLSLWRLMLSPTSWPPVGRVEDR